MGWLFVYQERKKWTERVVELETMLEEAKQSLEDTQYRFQRETAQVSTVNTPKAAIVAADRSRCVTRSLSCGIK